MRLRAKSANPTSAAHPDGHPEPHQEIHHLRGRCRPVGPRKPPNGGEMALQELTRRKPLLANRTAPEVEALIVELSLELPAYGQLCSCPG